MPSYDADYCAEFATSCKHLRALAEARERIVEAAHRFGWMPLVSSTGAETALAFFVRQMQMREDFGQEQFKRAEKAERERDECERRASAR